MCTINDKFGHNYIQGICLVCGRSQRPAHKVAPMPKLNKIYCGDCLELMKKIPDKSIDMILADLPYGTTACKWDIIIPFEPLWEQYKRIIKDNGAIVLTGQEPFSSYLRISNIKNYKYDWYWEKTKYSNFLCLKKQPAKNVENICIFYKNQPTYNPQMLEGKPYIDRSTRNVSSKQQKIGVKTYIPIHNEGFRFPNSTIKFSNGNNKNIHPTQKPVALFGYLIKTYTNEGDLVLDNVAGSGTTAIACINTKRNYILIEKEKEYCEIAEKRIKSISNKLF